MRNLVDIVLPAHVTKALYQTIVPYLITELALTKGDEIPLGIGATKEMFEDSPIVTANIMTWYDGHYVLNMNESDAHELIEQMSHMEKL